jgi:hypothetical protein
MTEYYPPPSRNDLIAKYGQEIRLVIPVGTPPHELIQEDHWEDVETIEDCIIRLLTERMNLSRQGY